MPWFGKKENDTPFTTATRATATAHLYVAEVRGLRMAGYTRDEAFEELRQRYDNPSDETLWEAINRVYS